MNKRINVSKAFDTPSLKEFKNFNYKEFIANLHAPAWLKSVLERIGRITKTIGKQVIEVGAKIVEKFAYNLKKYPRTSASVILMCLAVWLIPNIPFLGPLLKSILQIVGIFVTVTLFLIEAFGGLIPSIREIMNRDMNRSFAWAKRLETE